jgi:cold shock CspA family protein
VPKNARLRFFFGGLLLREFNELEGALVQFREALRLSPGSKDVVLEIARAHMYLRQFDEADRILGELASSGENRPWMTRKVHDTALQSAHRRAEERLEQHDFVGALESYEEFRTLYEAIPAVSRDALIRGRVDRARGSLRYCCEQVDTNISDDSILLRASQLQEWFSAMTGSESAQTPATASEGVVAFIKREKGFGFIRTNDKEIFFHRSGFLRAYEWTRIRVGSHVRFNLTPDCGERPRAIEISIQNGAEAHRR